MLKDVLNEHEINSVFSDQNLILTESVLMLFDIVRRIESPLTLAFVNNSLLIII